MTPQRITIGAAVCAVALSPLATLAPALSSGRPTARAAATRVTELSETARLADRRSLVVGDRFFQMGAQDGSYPATGFHTRGEMGGFWTQPIKLLDGLWFKAGGSWLTAHRYSNSSVYQRMNLGVHDGVRITRTDFVPDGIRAGLTRLRLHSATATTLDLQVDAHSELMSVYPWGETDPSQLDYNLQDTGQVRDGSLLFRETGRPPVPNADRHDYAAVVGSTLAPTRTALGPDFRGPQDPAVLCPASGAGSPTQPDRCDDTEYGKGTGGRLTYAVHVPAGGRTLWFAVAGSDDGVWAAERARAAALAAPGALLRKKVADARRWAAYSRVQLPGDRLLQRSVRWSKLNLAESVQEARDLRIRVTHAGVEYPAPQGRVARARWIGAGWPDYPWLFATDGEYSGFAAVASGQFDAIKAHLRALRDVSAEANGRSGKIVHEVTPDGQVYFGANGDEGNTDETAKFPSAVALVWRWTGDDNFRDEMYGASIRAMRYIFRVLDKDGDGWPEGLGNVEREGMGEEKLDNTVYTIRGLRDLADMAASKGDAVTRRWAAARARWMERRFERAWWFGPAAHQYADSLDDPGNTKVFQRHWIGLTPVEAEITKPGLWTGPLASPWHARRAVAKREEPCYSGEFGLFHTGTGATTAEGGNAGPSCDRATSTVASERNVFTLNTAIMATAEAAVGRTGQRQLQRYTTANARVQLDPSVWELPGAMPEISPSPDFGANIDKLFTERSSVLQAWGTYGTIWPVVHFELGVTPDMGRSRVRVVPQVPRGQHSVRGYDIRLGHHAIDVSATRSAGSLRTVVTRDAGPRLTIGAVLPRGASVEEVRLNGSEVARHVVRTARGWEVRLQVPGRAAGTSRLVVTLR